jgi:hypothetical protein
MTWRHEDLTFAEQVEQAAAKAALRLWNKIEEQADGFRGCSLALVVQK